MNVPHDHGPSATDDGSSLLGLPDYLPAQSAMRLVEDLAATWEAQASSLPERQRTQVKLRAHDTSAAALGEDLDVLRHWFDPVASGKRLREAVARLAPVPPHVTLETPLVFVVDRQRSLLTLEGRAALWILNANFDGAQGQGFWLDPSIARVAEQMVMNRYRLWGLHRLETVVGLLQADTATLRPTAAGLLLVLLINRNTSRDRRLPAPTDPTLSAAVSDAVARPALAFARGLAGTEAANSRGLDLYRGWAIGELARRLGPDLHQERDGIWIDESAAERALDRLADSLGGRDAMFRDRVPVAINAAVDSYENSRSILATLGLAHERPANTRKIVDYLLAASERRQSMPYGES